MAVDKEFGCCWHVVVGECFSISIDFEQFIQVFAGKRFRLKIEKEIENWNKFSGVSQFGNLELLFSQNLNIRQFRKGKQR